MSTRRFTKAEVPPGGLARSILLHQLFGIINNKTSKIGMACSVQRHQGLQNQTKVTQQDRKGVFNPVAPAGGHKRQEHY
jgi:hypothetical protein